MASLEDKAVETIDRITGVADQLAQKLTEYGPQVADVTLLTARISAIQEIVYGLGWAAMSYATWRAARLCLAKLKELDNFDDGIGWAVALAASSVASFGTAIGTLDGLLNMWAWAGAFEPQIWLAHKLLNI